MIKIRNLTVKYGNLIAVNDLSLKIEKGSIFGFIGPNGAGKTTTIKTLVGLLYPETGEVFINGYNVLEKTEKVREIVGYMPDFFGVYENLKVWEYLYFFGSLYNLSPSVIEKRIDYVLEITHLIEKKDRYIHELSRGMKQRLCLAKTCLHNPEVFILDEPASGIDPFGRMELRELIKKLKEEGKTVFISSHILSELSNVCDTFGIIEQGVLKAVGTLEEIKKYSKKVDLRKLRVKLYRERKENVLKILENYDKVSEIEEIRENEFYTTLPDSDEEIANFIKYLIENKLKITSVSSEIEELESVYKKLTEGKLA